MKMLAYLLTKMNKKQNSSINKYFKTSILKNNKTSIKNSKRKKEKKNNKYEEEDDEEKEFIEFFEKIATSHLAISEYCLLIRIIATFHCDHINAFCV